MALNATQSVDILFKKFVASKATTTTFKQFFEEGYNSTQNVLSNSVWLQSDQIPNIATASSVTQFVSVTMSYATGSNGAFIDPTGTLVDIIPFGYGDGVSYNYQIFRNNGVTSIAPGQSDWFFDNNSGILTFFSGTLNNGTITDGVTLQQLATSASPPIVKAWKYIGKKGVVPNLLGLTYSSGTMSINIGTGLTFSSGQLIVSGSIATYSGGLSYSNNVLTTVVGNGLTNSNNTLSVILSSGSGLTVSSSGLSVLYGTGLTSSNGQLALSNPISFSNGITNSGNTYSVNINTNGLTFSSGQVSLNIGTGLTFSSGQLQSTSVTTVGSGLTSSGNTYSVNINSNGLTFSNSQISLNIGTGLTFSSGQLQSTAVTTVGNGLTANGNTYSVNINSNGLTFSSGQVSLNIGTGLTFSSGQLQSTAVTAVGDGLTSSGNTYSVNINSNGLTFSSGQLSLNIGTGLTFSSGQLQSTAVTAVGNGLTSNNNSISINPDSSSGLTFSNSGSQLTILYSNSTPMISTIGSYGVGNTFSSVPLVQLLDGIFYPYIAPVLSLSVLPATLDYGNTQSATITWSVTKKKNNINGGTLSSASMTSLTLSSLQLTSGGSTPSYPTLNSNTTWTLYVSDYNGNSGSAVNSTTTTLSFSNRIFWGNIPSSNSLATSGSGTFSYSDLNSIGMSNQFGSTFVGLNKLVSSNGGYVAFIFPHSTFDLSVPGKVKLNNVTIDNNWVKVRDNIQFTNQYGYTGTNYDVWRYGSTQSNTNVTYYISA